jgi:hypothetical protein
MASKTAIFGFSQKGAPAPFFLAPCKAGFARQGLRRLPSWPDGLPKRLFPLAFLGARQML